MKEHKELKVHDIFMWIRNICILCGNLLIFICSFKIGEYCIVSEDGNIIVDSIPSVVSNYSGNEDILFEEACNDDLDNVYYFAQIYGIKDFLCWISSDKKVTVTNDTFPVTIDNTIEISLNENKKLQIVCFFYAEYEKEEMLRGRMLQWFIVWNKHQYSPNEIEEKYKNCNSVYFEVGEKTKKLADKLWIRTNDKSEYVKNVTHYVRSIKYDYEKADSDGVYKTVNQRLKRNNTDDILISKQGICLDKALLFAALLREKNIPCKIILGKINDKGHAWNEVYICGKWIFVDPTMGITEENGKNDNYNYKGEVCW